MLVREKEPKPGRKEADLPVLNGKAKGRKCKGGSPEARPLGKKRRRTKKKGSVVKKRIK